MELTSRFEILETNYLNKDEELRQELTWFIFDQSQLAKTFRRDVDELKRMQQEHMSKLEIYSVKSSFDELLQQQINKFYHYKHCEDDEEEDEGCDEQDKLVKKFEKSHEQHVLWLKKSQKVVKRTGSVVERFRRYDESSLQKINSLSNSRGNLR